MTTYIPQWIRYCLAAFCAAVSVGISGSTSYLNLVTKGYVGSAFWIGLVCIIGVEIGRPLCTALARSYKICWVFYVIIVVMGASYMHGYQSTVSASLDATVSVPAVQARFERERIEKERTKLQDKIDGLQVQIRTARRDSDVVEYRSQVAEAKRQLKEIPAPKLSLEEAANDVRERTKNEAVFDLFEWIVRTFFVYQYLIISETFNLLLYVVLGAHSNAFERNRERSEEVFGVVRTNDSSGSAAAHASRMNREDVERWILRQLPRVGDELTGTYQKWAIQVNRCSTATMSAAVKTLEASGDISVRRAEGGRGTVLRRAKVSMRLVQMGAV